MALGITTSSIDFTRSTKTSSGTKSLKILGLISPRFGSRFFAWQYSSTSRLSPRISSPFKSGCLSTIFRGILSRTISSKIIEITDEYSFLSLK